uniref:Uncharacterized protein n=1 Tax=Tanacetum cinerariifolium TaxID=118510 RepID=A0A6L2NKP0_TANCI|nr:hypothetical protein [Tanacetum cinerariifolium]
MEYCEDEDDCLTNFESKFPAIVFDDTLTLIKHSRGNPWNAEGRKNGARLSRGHFIRRFATYFGLVSDEGLRGLSMITRELSMIDFHELVRINICVRPGDTWSWVAPGPKRQQVATAGALEAAEDAPVDVESALAALAPVHAAQPPPAARTIS